MSKYTQTRDDLIEHLREQLDFLGSSAASYDAGVKAEAKRLAVVVRVMVHDTRSSHSILGMLGAKDTMPFMSTARPIRPTNLVATTGLVAMRVASDGASYAPLLSMFNEAFTVSFSDWWETPVAKLSGGDTFNRREIVLRVANKDGGAHVAPELDARYAALRSDEAFGWRYSDWSQGSNEPIEGQYALPAVRQIAYEVDETVRRYLVESGAGLGGLT